MKLIKVERLYLHWDDLSNWWQVSPLHMAPITEPQRVQISANLATLGSNEWWLLDLSCRLSIDRSTLARWCGRGWVHARQLPGQRKWWIIWADEDEFGRLRKLYEHGRGWPHHNGSPYSEELKRPKWKI